MEALSLLRRKQVNKKPQLEERNKALYPNHINPL
jgi:hypothetical protein